MNASASSTWGTQDSRLGGHRQLHLSTECGRDCPPATQQRIVSRHWMTFALIAIALGVAVVIIRLVFFVNAALLTIE